MKLFVYKTVKCEVINVKFLTRDLPLNNSAIMVKCKCLKYYFHQEECAALTVNFKKLTRLNYLIFERVYTFFSIFSWYFIVLHLLNFL